MLIPEESACTDKPAGRWRHTQARQGQSFVHPLPLSLRKLRDRIRDAIMSVDEDMLRGVCDESAFRSDVLRIAWGIDKKNSNAASLLWFNSFSSM